MTEQGFDWSAMEERIALRKELAALKAKNAALLAEHQQLRDARTAALELVDYVQLKMSPPDTVAMYISQRVKELLSKVQ